MKTLALIPVLLLGASAVRTPLPQEPVPDEHHEWLQQFVGEWDVVAEARMEPGAEPMRFELLESVRGIGKLWILAETNAEFGGQSFTSILTLGYDPKEKAFVGTWIDTSQTHLWHYRGQLDDAKKVLTLEAEGPSVLDPTKMANYRDVHELKEDGVRTVRSSIENEDGSWTQFNEAVYRRKKD